MSESPKTTANARRPDVWLQNLADERDGVALYAGLAEAEADPERAQTFAALADGERRHVQVWERKLANAGIPVPPDKPSARTRFLVWLARRWGTGAVLPLVRQSETNDSAKYARQGGRDGVRLAQEEREHGETLARLAGQEPPGARDFIAARERWHRGNNGGALRAAVFGMNDGLVSNLSLVLGVAAAGAGEGTLVVTGLAGLFAGAFSMAVGEYVSVASQRDLQQRQIDLERRELEEAPEEETAELADLLAGKGLSEEEARRTAEQMMSNKSTALDTLVREELGLDPGDLGSPVRAALSSFLMFGFGAGMPLIPLGLMDGPRATIGSAVVGGLVLSAAGAFLGFLSGTGVVRAGLRMLGLGAVASGVTVLVGRLVGTTIG